MLNTKIFFIFFHLELLCLFLKRSQHDFLVSKREISTEKSKVMASTKYDLFMEVYNSHHSEPGAKAIRPASPKYLDAIWAAIFRIKSSFYMEHGVDFDTFKANETVQTFVNDWRFVSCAALFCQANQDQTLLVYGHL